VVWSPCSHSRSRPGADDAVAAIAVTVVLSVLAHGTDTAPVATRCGKAVRAQEAEPGDLVPDVPVRGLPRRRHPDPQSENGSGIIDQ
jgi:hypothetical protein